MTATMYRKKQQRSRVYGLKCGAAFCCSCNRDNKNYAYLWSDDIFK